MIRHVVFSSTMRNSAQRTPIVGMGREIGMESAIPRCNFRKHIPASTRAAGLNGGDFISPCKITRGFDVVSIISTARNYTKIVMPWQQGRRITTGGPLTRGGRAPARPSGRARSPSAPLRQLHLHLEEPVCRVGGRLPHSIRQILLAHDRIHPHLAVGVKVG